jgi:CubicO group peptidase (beta-lactamase class C family)
MAYVDELPEDRSRAVESFVTDWLATDSIPGAALAVVEGDSLRYADGFGARDLAANVPATADTLFPVGSCTKTVTALAIAQLVEQGELAFDDPVTAYVDHFSKAPGEPITIAELLSHTSGMPTDGNSTALVTPVPFSGERDLRRYVADSVERRLSDEERFMYYNTGYVVLGRVVEAVSGERFADYVAEHIHRPLGMKRSAFDREAIHGDDDAAKTYAMREDGPEEIPFTHDELIHPPGGMASSARELSRYLRAMMHGGAFEGDRVLSEDLVLELQTPRATRARLLGGGERGYGYGWQTLPLLDDELVWHSGSVGISTAFLGYLREAHRGVALLCNTAPTSHPKYAGPAILAVLAGADPTTVPHFALQAKATPLLGEYESFQAVETATVGRDGAALELSISSVLSDKELTLLPETLDAGDHDYYTVNEAGERVPVEFRVDGDDVEMLVQRWRFQQV